MPVRLTKAPNEDFSLLQEGEMDRTQFNEAETNFQKNFRINGGDDRIRSDRQKFTKEAFVDALLLPFIRRNWGPTETKIPDGHEALVSIYYGLNGDEMLYGFGIIKGTVSPTDKYKYSYQEETYPSHYLDENGQFSAIPDSTFWNELKHAYLTQVMVRRNSGQDFENLVERRTDGHGNVIGDAEKVVLPWKLELEKMWEQTVGDSRDLFRFCMESVSITPGNYTDEFKHGVALFVQRKVLLNTLWDALLTNDAHSVTIYKDKASDYGNLCPPKCDKYVYPTNT